MKIKYTTHPKSAKLRIKNLKELHRQKMFKNNMSIVEFDNKQDLVDFLNVWESNHKFNNIMLENLQEHGNYCINLLRENLVFNGQSHRKSYEKVKKNTQ